MSETLALYIHIPFCVRKCPYCDFYSLTDLTQIPDYTEALCREISLRSDRMDSRHPVCSVYFGGGTPSVLPAAHISRILGQVQAGFRVASTAEITCELNPGTADARYLKDLNRAGITRLSIGVQSFDAAKLIFLERIHTRDQALAALDQGAAAGFRNISLDLIYALPDESRQTWDTDMDTALAFGPAHLSCYMLTCEPGTRLQDRVCTGEVVPMAPENRMALFRHTADRLTEQGYCHYEVSSFARTPQTRARHNSHYWQHNPYLGFGPGAHSFGRMATGAGIRSWNRADVSAYIREIRSGRLPPGDYEILTASQEILEQVMLGLRTDTGIAAEQILAGARNLADRLIASNLAEIYPGSAGTRRFRLTRDGMEQLDSIVEAFAGCLP